MWSFTIKIQTVVHEPLERCKTFTVWGGGKVVLVEAVRTRMWGMGQNCWTTRL